jgi:predicted ATPase/DNA-binding winged helix-turn-helix (wHTH) protein
MPAQQIGSPSAIRLRFGPFELNVAERSLKKADEVIPLGGRAFDILIILVEKAGEVVGKAELITKVWPDVTVEEGSLRVHLSALRKALGDGQFGYKFIANVQGRGYSFVAPVARLPAEPDWGNPSAGLSNLRPAPGRIIGRDDVVLAIQTRFQTERLITILGTGGIGKTTVALAVGHAALTDFSGAVFFVDLSTVRDKEQVIGAIASAIGLDLRFVDPKEALLDSLRARRALIILDSCEHLIEETAEVADSIFQSAPNIYMLATSRETLQVVGERVFRLRPLDCPPGQPGLTASEVLAYPAARLLVERVSARGGDVSLSDDDAPIVAEICRKLDGIALAIELVAGKAAIFGFRNTAARLGSHLDLMKFGRRTANPRHQTLEATLDWSHDHLSEVERVLLRRVAIFVGHFTGEAALAVAEEEGVDKCEIAGALGNLVNKSLIGLWTGSQGPLYRLLDTTRAYALEKLSRSGEHDSVAERHAHLLTQILEDKSVNLFDFGSRDALRDYLGNIRAALEWSFGPHGDDEIATRLAAASTRLFLELSLLIECRTWAERAMARLGDQHDNSRREMEIYTSLAFALMHSEGSSELVRKAFSRALDVAVIQGDSAYELRLLSGLFMYYRWNTDINAALDIASRSKEAASKTKDHDDMALAESMLGAADFLAGNHLDAIKHYESGLSHSASGSRFRAGQHLFHNNSLLLVGMARSLLYRGLLDQSLDYARLAIEEGEKVGHPATLCRSLSFVLPVYLALADSRRSEQYIVQLTELAAAYSLKPYRAMATGLRGQWLLLQNNLREGVPLLKRALEELHAQRHDSLNMEFLCDLGEGLIAMGEHQEALTLTVNAIDVQQRGGKFLYMPALFRMKGLILASRWARDHVEAEESLLSAIDWAKRQSATLFELKAATDLAELLLKQGRAREAHKSLDAALDRMPAGTLFPVHERALQVLNRLQSGIKAVG